MLADQLAPLIALAAKKGVTDLVPGWFQPWSGIETNWHDTRPYNGYPQPVGIKDDAAALITTGSLSNWLAGQGIAVVKSDEGGTDWWRLQAIDGSDLPDWWDLETDDYMGGLISAATARLEEMPDAAGGAESPAASKEGGRQ